MRLAFLYRDRTKENWNKKHWTYFKNTTQWIFQLFACHQKILKREAALKQQQELWQAYYMQLNAYYVSQTWETYKRCAQWKTSIRKKKLFHPTTGIQRTRNEITFFLPVAFIHPPLTFRLFHNFSADEMQRSVCTDVLSLCLSVIDNYTLISCRLQVLFRLFGFWAVREVAKAPNARKLSKSTISVILAPAICCALKWRLAPTRENNCRKLWSVAT